MISGENVIEVKNLSKSFHVGEQDVQVLKDVSFNIKWGDFVVVFGPSGSGKSTILYSLLGLEEPSEGIVKFLDENIFENKDEDYRSDFRKKHIGTVYQQANWIRSLTVKENVAFPMMLLGNREEISIQRAIKMLEAVDMQGWADYMPTELSAGQQQRVSLARALINNPSVIIADEPTGNLDYESGQDIMSLLRSLNKEKEKTVIMVTHDLEYLTYASSAIRLFDGQIVGVYKGKNMNELYKDLKLKRGVLKNIVSSDGSEKRDDKVDTKGKSSPGEGLSDDENGDFSASTSSDVKKDMAKSDKKSKDKGVKEKKESKKTKKPTGDMNEKTDGILDKNND